MEEFARLMTAIDYLRPELPKLIGENWSEIESKIFGIQAQVVQEPNRAQLARAQLLMIFARYPAAQAKLVELLAELQASDGIASFRGYIQESPTVATAETLPTVIRYTDISCPRRIWIGATRISVVVRLTVKPSDQSTSVEELALRTDIPVQIQIEAPQFEVLNGTMQELAIPARRDSSPLVFDLRPLAPGHTKITFDFFQNGQPLRTVSTDIEITTYEVVEGTVAHQVQALRMEPDGVPLDMIFHVAWNPVSNSLQMTLIRKGGSWWRTFEPVMLNGDPAAHATQLYSRIIGSGRNTFNPEEQDAIDTTDGGRRMKKLGQNLWEDLIPSELKRLYAEEREQWRDNSLLMLSDEPYLPWELIWPYDDESAEWEDEGPWCQSLNFARWLRKDERGNGNEMAPMRLEIDAFAVLVPAYTKLGNLPYASQEESSLIGLMQRHHLRRSGPTNPTWKNVIDFLESGDYNWIHFAAHGSFSPGSPDGDATLWLQEDHALSPQDLSGADIRRHFRQQRPVFFLNACDVGRQGFALTRLSGWANRLVSAGAGLFIGPLWAVNDQSAATFAGAFYQALLEGETWSEPHG